MKSLLYVSAWQVGVVIASAVSANACGIDWKVPVNHFNGVNETGELSYWRDIGQVDLGDGLKVPLTIGFKPTRGGFSWLGKGWIIPILESNIIQVDEKKFLLTQPDGITRQFWRKTATSSDLTGQGNWKGAIDGNSVALWADCGWKLVFSKGRLASISTPKNRVLNILYVNGRASEIQENGRTMLKVESDSTGAVRGLTFGANHVGVELADKPCVETINGVNVVGGMEKSLHKLIFRDNREAIYDFGLNDKRQPTLNISGDAPQTFTWEAATGHLLQNGSWNYNIVSGPDING